MSLRVARTLMATPLLLCNTLFAQHDGSSSSRATVRVALHGPFGERVGKAEVHLWTLDRKTDLAADSGSLVIKRVPYDIYILRAFSPSGAFAERQVIVNVPEMLVRLGLPVRLGDSVVPGGWLKVSGIIRPAPKNPEDWWVKVHGVFLDFSRECPLDKTGRFLVAGLDMGAYLVEVLEGPKLRYVRAIKIDPKTPETVLSIGLDEARFHIP